MNAAATLPEQPFPAPGHDHEECMRDLLTHARELCLKQGAELTPHRRQVLEILASSHQALGAYDILGRMGGHQRRLAPMVVYRALDFLMGLGLVHRLAGRSAYFACRRSHAEGEVQYWICQRCLVVAETAADSIAGAFPGVAEGLGFRVERVNIEIEGECPQCRAS
ncbi:MAG: transcriptional repressor [Magnetococcales bacterium]|nr:transcriptional repressor [Magnetococcales bacterium]